MYKFLLAALTLSTISCSGPVNIFGNATSPHHKRVSQLTRSARFYGVDDIEYITYVTYKSEGFRKSYVDEYAVRFNLPPDQKEAMLKNELDEAAQYDVFVFSHFATNRQTSRLTKEAKTWRLTLSTSEDKTSGEEPENIEGLNSTYDPNFAYFYPHAIHWSVNYLVKFKKLSPTPLLVVRMAGVSGDVKFEWEQKNDYAD